MPALQASVIRITLAWIALGIYSLIAKKQIAIPKKRILMVWLTGIFAQGLPFTLLFFAEKSVSAGFAGLMNGTSPLWAFVFGLMFLRKVEAFTLKKLFGITLGFLGVLVIFWPNVTATKSGAEIMGAMAALCMAVSYGLSFAMNRMLLSGKNRLDLNASLYHQEIGSLVFLIPLLFLSGEWRDPSWLEHWRSILLSLIYLGVISTAFGSVVYLKFIREWGMIRSSVIVYIVPVAAVVFDILIYGNLPHVNELAGGVIVLMSVMLVQEQQVRQEA